MSLRLHNLVVRKNNRTLVDVPDLQLAPGQVHALLGPNGAGKSTLLGALGGLERSAAPHVLLHDKPLSAWDTLDLARHRALMLQEHQLPFDFDVHDIIRMGRYPHGEHPHPQEADLARQVLQRVDGLKLLPRRYQQLSGGEKARVQLARTLAQILALPTERTPRWLLLDEPTAALDLAHQHAVMRLLRQLAAEGTGVLVVLHDINLAGAYADQALVMSQGHIVAQGPCRQVLEPGLVEDVWGVRCERLERTPRPAHPAPMGGWLAFS